jgi:hypothetical protein
VGKEEEELLEYPEFYDDIDPEMMEEFIFAEQESRQPNCIYCGKPLEVGQTFYTRIYWHWNSELRRYDKCEDRDADCDKPYCLNCETKDWDFTNNKWLQY